MAKRSPILGYNHNVRYRGLVFHVQTEDSGVLSPHLFTHLFHAGVIVSTRKLVYDAGSGEDSIKSLMQAQHKAVLKDLRKGTFDDKIDQYLGGTPGLLPRGAVDPGADAPPELAKASSSQLPVATEPMPKLEASAVDDSGVTRKMSEREIEEDLAASEASAPSPPVIASMRPEADNRRDPTIPDVRPGLAGRTVTAERRSAPSRIGTARPADDSAPLENDAMTGATANATIRTARSLDFDGIEDLSPEIEIQLELDDPEEDDVEEEARQPRTRSPRDTDLAVPGALDDHTRPTIDVSALSDGIPSFASGGPTIRQVNDSIPPLPAPPNAEVRRTPSAGVGASALPPGKPITRPAQRPAMTPQQVVTRAVGNEDRGRRESDAVEVYAPAPPSADVPPGLREAERPGQYSQHKRVQREPTQPREPRERSQPIPPGLGRPGRVPQPAPPSPRGTTGSTPVVREPVHREATPLPIPNAIPGARPPEHTPSNPNPRPRTPTPTRTSGPSTPRANNPSSGGVVMTRPAVIVGAPAKPAPPRVRKAREDEGRGFGQGLISEKSLDEVILAYLSEDADDK